MDCTSARLLLNFVRTAEIDRSEQEVLDNHLAGCPECAAFAQSENRFDDALATAMPRVAVPAGLKGGILEQLARARRPRPWPWAAAAVILLAAGSAVFVALSGGPEEIDPLLIVQKVDVKATPEAVEALLGELGSAVTVPRDFDFSLLDGVDIAEIQGRKVPKLTFLSRANNRAVLAHVYVLSTRQFKPPNQPEEEAALKNGWLGEAFIQASTHNIQIRRNANVADFFYLMVYTSGSLDPFLLQGI